MPLVMRSALRITGGGILRQAGLITTVLCGILTITRYPSLHRGRWSVLRLSPWWRWMLMLILNAHKSSLGAGILVSAYLIGWRWTAAGVINIVCAIINEKPAPMHDCSAK